MYLIAVAATTVACSQRIRTSEDVAPVSTLYVAVRLCRLFINTAYCNNNDDNF